MNSNKIFAQSQQISNAVLAGNAAKKGGHAASNSASSFFEKHAFGGAASQALGSAGQFMGASAGAKAASKIPAASSSYNMHR